MNFNAKYRKPFKPYVKEGNQSRDFLNFKGDIGLRVIETGYVTASQLEAGRVAIGRVIKRKPSIRIFVNAKPNRIITAKPAEVRMGKGKGSFDHLIQVVESGFVLYELSGVEYPKAVKALSKARKKLACRTTIFLRPRFRHERNASSGLGPMTDSYPKFVNY